MIPAHKDTIMVHCLATRPSWAKGKSIDDIVKEVTRWHVQERGWSAIAYAAIIGLGGAIGKGRDLDGDGDVWEETGAGAKGWNKNVIHLALVGGKGGYADDKFSDHYTEQQDVALRKTIAEIEALAGRKMRIMGHNEVAAKACPCFNVKQWYAAKPPVKAVKPSASFWTALIAFLKGLKR